MVEFFTKLFEAINILILVACVGWFFIAIDKEQKDQADLERKLKEIEERYK